MGRRKDGNPLKPWGQEPQRDCDQIMHWIVDIDRTIDRLASIRQALKHSMLELAVEPQNPKGEMMEFAAKISGQVVAKANNLYQTIRTRRLVNGGSFKRSEKP